VGEATPFLPIDNNGVPARERCCATIAAKWKLVQPHGHFASTPRTTKRYAERSADQGLGNRGITGKKPHGELYDIAKHPGETKTVAAEHPDIVESNRSRAGVWSIFRPINSTSRIRAGRKHGPDPWNQGKSSTGL